MREDLHPYVVFLPAEQKVRILGAIFGSKSAVEILKFSLVNGISSKIYQKDLMVKLGHSNKTIIENLKSLTRLGVLQEEMEKSKKDGRIVWVKTYQLSNAGKWFALLLAGERDLTEDQEAEILQDLFRLYIKWVMNLSERLHVKREMIERIFLEEMRAAGVRN